MADSAFFCVLSHEGVLAVRGSDASKFLQGQLTCNMSYLNEHFSSLGARCTQKGRMQSSFRIVSQADGYLLAMAHELIEAQLADLKKYAVFSKSKLTDESAGWARFGLSQADDVLNGLGLELAPQSSVVARADDLIAICVSPGRVELWAPAEQAPALQERLAGGLREAPLNDWLLGQVEAGIAQVMPQTRESFIPQMLNLQAVGAVSFKKGCYTGQEIVARMQYLGKLKRRLYRVDLCAPALADTALPEPGTGIFAPGHAGAVGEVALAARDVDDVRMLAVLQADAAVAGDLRLGSQEGPPLSLGELPYTLDRDREIQR
jgi:folate-binding protein YgfZ